MQQGLHVPVEGGQANFRVVPSDDAPIAQGAHPFQASGRCDAQGTSEVPVGLPSIALQMLDNRRIKFVHGRQFFPIAEYRSLAHPKGRPDG
jgi:hypothetical protein